MSANDATCSSCILLRKEVLNEKLAYCFSARDPFYKPARVKPFSPKTTTITTRDVEPKTGRKVHRSNTKTGIAAIKSITTKTI